MAALFGHRGLGRRLHDLVITDVFEDPFSFSSLCSGDCCRSAWNDCSDPVVRAHGSLQAPLATGGFDAGIPAYDLTDSAFDRGRAFS